MSEVKERPIIFSGPMVRAILEGRKTQTRRVIRPQILSFQTPVIGAEIAPRRFVGAASFIAQCKYGQPGDRLWVRESFSPDWCDHPIYRADGGSAIEAGYSKEPRWKPSIHMPRRASRITLEITDVSVERLQDITEADAQAEGCKAWMKDGVQIDTARSDFIQLWEEINASRGYSWESNPFVWVLSFKVITPANNAMQATRLRVASASA